MLKVVVTDFGCGDPGEALCLQITRADETVENYVLVFNYSLSQDRIPVYSCNKSITINDIAYTNFLLTTRSIESFDGSFMIRLISKDGKLSGSSDLCE